MLTYDNFSLIKEDVINGITQKEMCKKYNVSLSTLKRFLTKYNLNNISHKKQQLISFIKDKKSL